MIEHVIYDKSKKIEVIMFYSVFYLDLAPKLICNVITHWGKIKVDLDPSKNEPVPCETKGKIY